MTDDRLRETYRVLQAEGSPGCPTDEELAALALGEPEPARRDALADHVVRCRRCSETAGLLLEMRRETAGLGQARPVPTRRRWFSLAAAAAALAAIAVLVARSSGPSASAERGRPLQTAGVDPADGAVLSSVPGRFAWPASHPGDAYRLRLFRDSGDLVWDSGRLSDNSANLPEDVRAALPPGQSYYWAVEVAGPAAATRIGPFSFRIAPPESRP